MNKKFINYIGSLALALVALFFTATGAHAQYAPQHLTNTEVETNYNAFVQQGRTAPEFLSTAFFYGDGVYVFENGDFRLESEQNLRNQAIAHATFDAVMLVHGDYVLASQAAGGLLTPDELEEALYPEYGGGGYQFLCWITSPWGDYSNNGPGGGGYLY